ncbi:hypothetical protein KFZ70_07030 [Tamlana fucoidanivorans]|uniref:Periplasmic heavy metal sensor n=1 Tax=Allotamlana fucoidanivorans TaxID=2583814 RepID=A0A5C4SM90_9FLAO|nr:hypothetical protein [Tamlana fucoidanivorans]TNJ45237.1 hypothetical protein FGF67_05880 [Tamlana fucoidanivorans]
MKKNIVLYILFLFLVIANGFFLYNYVGNNIDRKGKDMVRPGDFILKELQFSEEQMEALRMSSVGHHERMKRCSEELKRLKDLLFNTLSEQETNETKTDSIISLIGQVEMEKEKEAFSHFKTIQTLCNNKQKERFKRIINDALHKHGRQEQRPPSRATFQGAHPPHPQRMDSNRHLPQQE